MAAQDLQGEWKTLHQVEYDGDLEVCRQCGSIPQLYALAPVLRQRARLFFKTDSFVAVRCSCGATGPLKPTGVDVFGTYITEDRAALRAATAWNLEQKAF